MAHTSEQLYALLTHDEHKVRQQIISWLYILLAGHNTCCFVAFWPATPSMFHLPVVCGEAIIAKAECFEAVVNEVSCIANSAGLHQLARHSAYQLKTHWSYNFVHANLNVMHASVGGGHRE